MVRSVERGDARRWVAHAVSTASSSANKRSRRAYWLKHHGSVWYGLLVTALVGRYLLYAVVAARDGFGGRAGRCGADRARSGRDLRAARRLSHRQVARTRACGDDSSAESLTRHVSLDRCIYRPRSAGVRYRRRASAGGCLAVLVRAEHLGANGVVGLQFETLEKPDGSTVSAPKAKPWCSNRAA